ncbi:salivary glue Sgs, putative [Babesia ovata]|uniref:Salivary glue Sgs, putative n=1 Tax=Babesia ovata TaxID=189622 RepID=A0A2H6KBT4_9APIC|nr:salivary glue Sgs, putative [Babesia ovata]GBE60447.1 salivary glue Sgs, putative [Babesia ovata]
MESQPSTGSTQHTNQNPRKRRGIVFRKASSSTVQDRSPPAVVLRSDEKHEDISQPENTKHGNSRQYTVSNKPVRDLRADFEVHSNYQGHQKVSTPSPTSDVNIRNPSRQLLGSTHHRRVLGAVGPLHRAILQADSHNRALEKAEMWKRYRQSRETATPKKRSKDTPDRV